MATVTVTSKGQITIPVEVRNALSLKTGDKLDITPNATTGGYDMKPRTGNINDLFGFLKYDGPPATIEQMNEAIADHLGEEDERIKREWNARP